MSHVQQTPKLTTHAYELSLQTLNKLMEDEKEEVSSYWMILTQNRRY
jgi:hypothetical protein